MNEKSYKVFVIGEEGEKEIDVPCDNNQDYSFKYTGPENIKFSTIEDMGITVKVCREPIGKCNCETKD